MNDTIKALGESWRLLGVVAFFVFLLIFILVYKTPISGVMGRLQAFLVQKGDTTVSMSMLPPPSESTAEPSREQAVAELSPPADEPNEIVPVTEPEDESARDWERQIYIGYATSNLPKMETAYRNWQEEASDPTERLRNEAWYQSLRYRRGDRTALDRLLELSKQATLYPDAAASILVALGNCYKAVRDFEKADTYYGQAIETATTDYGRAQAVVLFADALGSQGRMPEAQQRLSQEIENTTDMDNVAALYKGLASLYHKEKNYEMRALALEKAIQSKPDDPDIHFEAAYSYGLAEQSASALLHYDTLWSCVGLVDTR